MSWVLSVDAVCTLVRRQLGGSVRAETAIGADTRVDELGLSSLQVSDIVFTLEEELGVEFDMACAAEVVTIGDLVQLANATEHGGVVHSPSD